MEVLKVNNNVHLVSDLEDLKDILADNIYNTIETITENKVQHLQEQLIALNQEFKSYERENDFYRRMLLDTLDELEEATNYILNSKRLDKNKLLQMIKTTYNNIHNNI